MLASRNATARANKKADKEVAKAEKKAAAQVRRVESKGVVEDRAVTGLAAAAGAVAGAAAQIKLVDPNVENIYVKRGAIPVFGGVGAAIGFLALDGTASAAVAGTSIGMIIGSASAQLVQYLTAP